jgi:hypothetical protein
MLETGKAGKIPGERISGACEAPELRFEVSFLGILWLIYESMQARAWWSKIVSSASYHLFTHLFTDIRSGFGGLVVSMLASGTW